MLAPRARHLWRPASAAPPPALSAALPALHLPLALPLALPWEASAAAGASPGAGLAGAGLPVGVALVMTELSASDCCPTCACAPNQPSWPPADGPSAAGVPPLWSLWCDAWPAAAPGRWYHPSLLAAGCWLSSLTLTLHPTPSSASHPDHRRLRPRQPSPPGAARPRGPAPHPADRHGQHHDCVGRAAAARAGHQPRGGWGWGRWSAR